MIIQLANLQQSSNDESQHRRSVGTKSYPNHLMLDWWILYALVSVNALPDPEDDPESPEDYRDDFETFWDDLAEKDEVDIVTYHFPYWFDIDSGFEDLDNHFTWHNQEIGFGKAIVIDDDGDYDETWRSDNDNVADWSDICTFDNDYNFNHKDYQQFETGWGFIQDYRAMFAVGPVPIRESILSPRVYRDRGDIFSERTK